MPDETNKAPKDISLMEPGDYYIIDPSWSGQQTLYIIRAPQTRMWVFKSVFSLKYQFKEYFIHGLVAVFAFIVIYFGWQSDLFPRYIYIIIIVLFILGGLTIYFTNRKVTLLQCNSWKLILNKQNAFRRLKHEWKLEEIQGFHIEENSNPPATAVGSIYNLKVLIRNQKITELIPDRAYEELIWISEGLNKILGFEESALFRDEWRGQREGMTSEFRNEEKDKIIDIKFSREKIGNFDKPDGINIEIQEVENSLSVTLRPANAGKWKILRIISLILMLISVAVSIFLIIYVRLLGAFLITLIIVPIIVIASFLWAGSSAIRKDSVVILTDGKLVWIWSGRSRFCLIHPDDLEQVSIRKGNQYSYYVGVGIPKRRWFSFSKNYILDISLKNKTVTSLNLPFDKPECDWIAHFCEEIFVKYDKHQQM